MGITTIGVCLGALMIIGTALRATVKHKQAKLEEEERDKQKEDAKLKEEWSNQEFIWYLVYNSVLNGKVIHIEIRSFEPLRSSMGNLIHTSPFHAMDDMRMNILRNGFLSNSGHISASDIVMCNYVRVSDPDVDRRRNLLVEERKKLMTRLEAYIKDETNDD